MNAEEIIDQIRTLSSAERAKVVQFIANEEDWSVPESFKAGMKAAAEGRFVEMEMVLNETPPPHLR